MNIYIDETIHEKHGFLLLAFVSCLSDPQDDLTLILKEHKANEYHSLVKMQGNNQAQQLRNMFNQYLNTNCGWGIFVLPSNIRWSLTDELPDFLSQLYSTIAGVNEVKIYMDEGIVQEKELQSLRDITNMQNIGLYKSHEVKGIQLADLVASLCGVRLIEAISKQPKMLEYGDESGFDPPIIAKLGCELWASLRYTMHRSSTPIGNDIPEMAEFLTKGTGLHISELCPKKLTVAAEKVFGKVYLGCIH